jgi:hypothetical protein
MSRLRASAAAATLLALSLLVLAPVARAAVERPLTADLVGAFTFGGCPAGAPVGALCLHDSVSGQISYLGGSTGEFDVVIDTAAAGADGCAPANKVGSFVAANGDRLDVTARGTYCFPTSVATYAYTVTGGSGCLAGATGTGTWLVPPPTTLSPMGGVGDEHLRGTIAVCTPAGLTPGLAVAHSPATVTRGKANVLLTCPAGPSGCSGSLTLSVRRRIIVRRGHRRSLMHTVTVGRARFSLAAAATRTVRVLLSAGARLSLAHARGHRLRVTTTIANSHRAVTLVQSKRAKLQKR